jgi:hypothetical protein
MGNIDKNYWLKRWYERRFLDRIWEQYPDGEWSWHDIFDYIRSGRFEVDVLSDISLLAQIELEERNKKED